MKLFFLLTVFYLYKHVNSKLISTSVGALNGAQVGDAHLFKKVPFSMPPLGKLRFQKPVPIGKWKGVWDSTEYGPACMSNSSITSSPQKWVDEDCLHLNIFTSEHCLTHKNCAVMVYFHGGGLEYDSAVMFNDTVIIDNFVSKDIVFVIPAFRLGIFSHFVVEDQSIAPNNLALYDILLGLEFVHREIEHFGGDHKKVTLLGHSYGGSVASVMAFSTEINRDLRIFQQIVVMSSARDFDSLEVQLGRFNNFVEHSNCSLPSNISLNQKDTLILKCLQEKSAMELLRIQRHLQDLGFQSLTGLVQREPLFQEVPYSEFMAQPKNIATMVGCTKFEQDDESYEFPVGEAIGFENREEVEEKFRKDKKEGNYDFEGHADETQAIMVQSRYIANTLIEHRMPVYLYEFTYPKHALHTDDLSYLMGVHRFEMDENERQLAEVYRTMFIQFAKCGDPGSHVARNSTYFDVYWNETSGRRPRMEKDFEKEIIDYWFKDMVGYDKNITMSSKIARNLSKSFRLESIDYETNWKLFSLLLISSIFLAGCLFGRCICPSKRDLYIRLDGTDQQLKHF